MNTAVCLVCRGGYSAYKLPGLLACKQCGFVTADIAISPEEIQKLYTASYFAGEEYHDYLAERHIIEKNFRARLANLLPHISEAHRKRLFEIGSAYGFFLSVAREHFRAVEGIDISCDAVSYAANALGLNVHTGDFLDYPLSASIDVVCLWDTVEHLKSPDLYIEKIAAHMAPGGIIALTTGDIGSLVARMRGAKWRQIHPPTHLHYFSKDTISRLLRRCGFEVRCCRYEGMHRSLDTIAYVILNIKHKLPDVYRTLKRAGLLNWHVHMNLYDIMFVVAERQ
jgi:SAM-dependent methyltransferase